MHAGLPYRDPLSSSARGPKAPVHGRGSARRWVAPRRLAPSPLRSPPPHSTSPLLPSPRRSSFFAAAPLFATCFATTPTFAAAPSIRRCSCLRRRFLSLPALFSSPPLLSSPPLFSDLLSPLPSMPCHRLASVCLSCMYPSAAGRAHGAVLTSLVFAFGLYVLHILCYGIRYRIVNRGPRGAGAPDLRSSVSLRIRENTCTLLARC